MCKPDVYLQSMSEVFQALKLESQSLTCASEDMQVFLCNTCEFPEKMGSEVPTATHRRVEDFEKLPLEDFEGEEPFINSPCSLDMLCALVEQHIINIRHCGFMDVKCTYVEGYLQSYCSLNKHKKVCFKSA